MRKLLYLCIAVILFAVTLIGCTTKSLPTSVVGEWELETISDIDGNILVVGKGYNDDDDDAIRQKKDIMAIFNEDSTFEIIGDEENLQGEYNQDQELSTPEAMAINMALENGTEILAVYGIRKYQDGSEINSLIFTLDEKIYSFTKPIA